MAGIMTRIMAGIMTRIMNMPSVFQVGIRGRDLDKDYDRNHDKHHDRNPDQDYDWDHVPGGNPWQGSRQGL